MTSGCVFFFFVSVSIAFVPVRELITQHQLALALLAEREGKKKKNTNPTEGWWTDATNRAKTALIF